MNNNEIWKTGLYQEARDEGHSYMLDNPDSGYTELQAHCYNFLMEFEPTLVRYGNLCDQIAHKAAKRAHDIAVARRQSDTKIPDWYIKAYEK